VLAQHSWAERCAWSELETSGDAPVLYVANGSHATYAMPGTHDRPFPDPNDEGDGAGPEVRPAASPIDDGSPAWVDARPCGSGAPGRPWQFALELGFVALLGLGTWRWLANRVESTHTGE
jgi:hypothetical protein